MNSWKNCMEIKSYGSTVQFVKDATILEWADYVWGADNSIVKTVLVNNLNSRKIPRGRP